jgi:hypothetical protein
MNYTYAGKLNWLKQLNKLTCLKCKCEHFNFFFLAPPRNKAEQVSYTFNLILFLIAIDIELWVGMICSSWFI